MEQDEVGLNLYDMELRDYDPAIGRWTGMDPVTHHNQSTYNAFDGNPVSIADPSGADGFGVGAGGENFTSVFGMVISTPTNTGMYTGYAPNASFGSLYQRSLGSNFGNNTVYASSLGDIEAVMSSIGNSVSFSPNQSTVSVGNLSEGEFLDQEDPKFVSEQQRMNYEINKFLLNAVFVVDGVAVVSALRWKAVLQLFTKSGVKIEEAILQKFVKHAFANGRHSDLGMSVNKITTNTAETISKNFSRLKTGDNTLHLTINGVQKTIMVNIHNGTVRSMNMYSGISNRATQGTVIELGKVKW